MFLRKSEKKQKIDYLLLGVVLFLVGLGLSAVLSSSISQANKLTGDPYYFFKKQLLFAFFGLLAMFFFIFSSRQMLLAVSFPGILVSILLLVMIFIPGIGKTVNGANSWIDFGIFSFQPSEPVKLFIILFLAKVFSEFHRKDSWDWAHVAIPLIMVISILVLILLQSDLGTALHIFIFTIILIFAAGFPLLYLISIALFSIPLLYIFVYKVEKKWRRVLAFLDPFADPQSKGYQLVQSLTAFYYGGFWGRGLGNGTQKNYRLPEPHTDFIFAAIAEELGIFWSLIVLTLFITILVRGIKIIFILEDFFLKILGVGILAMLLTQALLNIGVVTGSLPVTGIPLPFISYGGSSLVTSMAAMGILICISKWAEKSQDR